MRISNNPPKRLVLPNYILYEDIRSFLKDAWHGYFLANTSKYRSERNKFYIHTRIY